MKKSRFTDEQIVKMETQWYLLRPFGAYTHCQLEGEVA